MSNVSALYKLLKTRAVCGDEDRYILFHGTNVYFSVIDLKKTKDTSDFGRGFYLTNILEQAVDWAGKRRRDKIVAERDSLNRIVISHFGNAYVLKYELSFEELGKLNLNAKVFDKYSREWLDAILLGRRCLDKNDNRVEKPDEIFQEYDIITGPMADNSLKLKLDEYEWKVDNHVPHDRNELLEEIKMEKENYQIVFRTKKSLQAIKRLERFPSIEL